MFTVKTDFGTYENCDIERRQYANKHIALQLFCEDGPLATITTNIDGIEKFPTKFSCVDTNNCPWAENFIKENNLGKPTGIYLSSGYCNYPVYEFYTTK